MSQGGSLHHGQIELADEDRDYYEGLELRLARHPSETAERLVLRLLAFALFHEPGLEYRSGVCDGERPDLFLPHDSGAIAHWIDVGTPDAARLQKAARHCDRVSVLSHDGLLRTWKQRCGGELPAADNLQILLLEADFVDALAQALERRFHWQLNRTGGTVYLFAAEAQWESQLTLVS